MILIKGGTVIDPVNKIHGIFDILIENGKIKKVDKKIEFDAKKIIDAKGKYVFPGLVDMHCHLREPGFEYKETIKTGTLSAACGGYTSVACMPNTNPVIDNQEVVKFIQNKAVEEGSVNVFVIGSITKGLKGEELSEIGKLKDSGCVAVSDDGRPVVKPLMMKNVLNYAKVLDIPVISHCEELALLDEGVMNEGYNSTVMGLRGNSRAVEEVMVARDCIIAESLNVPIHIAHVSTDGSIDLIRHFKKRGVKVTAETCPHYFSLTDDACRNYNTLAKVNPPLREAKDVEAVRRGLADGTIDVIATDHAPHHMDEKNVEFNLAANGLVGFETAFALCYTNLVKGGILKIEKLIEKMSANPSQILKINKGAINIGDNADLTIVDTNREYTVNINEFVSKSKNSPYDGMKLYGKIEYTIVGGKIAYEGM